MEIVNMNTVKLCRAGSCCPIVERKSDDEYVITDDFEGNVKITKDQMRMLKDAIDVLVD